MHLAQRSNRIDADGDDDHFRDPAFIIAHDDTDAVVTLAADACEHDVLGRSTSWEWAAQVRGRIVLDASRVPRMTPPLCRWITKVVRGAGPRRVAIHGSCAGLRETVLVLRLDAVVNP